MKEPSDLEVIEKAKPFIRSIAAFLLVLRFGEKQRGLSEQVDHAYGMADEFLKRLIADMGAK